MFCFTLLKLLNVCKWILIFNFFPAIDTCCIKGWNVPHWIFARKEDGFTISIMFISHLICLGLHCFVLCRCLLILYLFISRLLFGFLNFFCNNLFVSRSFHALLSLHYLFFYCCLLVLYLFISLIVV
jgi:hypothetical protein